MSARTRAARRAACAAIVMSGGFGCGQLVGADDYEYSAPGADGSSDAGNAELPILPALPDSIRVDACTACVEERCGDKRSQCLESERCRNMLACVGGNGCSDPNCIARCTDTLPESPYFWDYFGCAFQTRPTFAPTPTQCFAECGAGDNWECLGKYRWDLAEGWDPRLRVRVFDANLGLGSPIPFPGLEIAACLDGEQQASPPGDTGCADWTSLTLYGEAELTFGSGFFHASSFAVRSPATGERERIYTRPILRSGTVWLPLLGWLVKSILITTNKTPFDPGAGLVSATQLDCLGIGSPADIRLDDPPAGVARWCTGPPGGRLVTDCSSPSTLAYFTNVPPAWNLGITSSLPDGRRASHQSVLTGAYWNTSAILYPMDSQGR